MRHAVILAGGSGTRLWPASRKARPKQFLDPGGTGESLLAAAVRRARAAIDGSVVVVTAAEHVAQVRAHAPDVEVLAEPMARNTAAAIGLAAVNLAAEDDAAVLGILPADQHIADEAGLAAALARAFAAAETANRIVTIGLRPTRPDTGFGYLELGDEVSPGVRAVARFVEKPARAAAEAMVADGRHLWNGGMFFLRARRLLDELAAQLPQTAAGLDRIAAALAADGSDRELGEITRTAYAAMPSISIDHGVMERARDVVTVPADVGWSDVGSWAALAELRAADGDGNITAGEVVICDGARNVVVGDAGRAIALVGVSDLVVVQAGDALLVVPRERAQDVRLAVAALERAGLERYL